jgi:uncharacterized protein
MTADFRAGYVRRVVDAELDVLLPDLPAILLDGPKAVGKTATALQRARTVHRLHEPAVRAIAEADPRLVLAAPYPVLLDEWQRVPALWDAVKTATDDDLAGGRFLLTGSLPSGGTHSGAGRIASLRVRPLTLPERGASTATVSIAAMFASEAALRGSSALGLADYTDLILASGFPGMQHLRGRALQTQLDGYLQRIVDADVREAGLTVRRPSTMMAWLRAYAAATATATAWDGIRDAASAGQDTKPAKTTTIPYVDVLTRLRILDELPAWSTSRNHLRRLAQGPKHHLADPALAARLVGATRGKLLRGTGEALTPHDGTFLGQLFESLATLSVRVFAGTVPAQVSHLRVQNGRHEVDLVVEREEDRKVVAFEVKLSPTVDDRDVRHLLWLKAELGDDLADCAVLTTGSTAYRRPDGVGVIPLALLGP